MKKYFILGNPRSGTTLFRLMINSHPNMVCPPECGFLTWWYSKYKEWDNSSWLVHQFVEDLRMSKKIEGWGLDFDKVKHSILGGKPATYGEVGQIIYQVYAEQKGKKINVIADKNNYYINRLDILNEIWPDAGYILIIRDGRDVACSYKNLESLSTNSPYKPHLPSSIDLIAEEWTRNNKSVLDFFSRMEKERSLVIKYEDLVIDPVVVLTRVCDFMNEKYNEEMLNYHVYNLQTGDEPPQTLDWKRKTLEKPDANNIGKFRVELKKEEINQFNHIASPLLRLFGYGL